MNYSFIEFAQKQLTKLEDDYLGWRNKISLSLFTLAKANFSEEQKKKMYDGLLERTNSIIGESEKILDRLKETRFSESESFLHEEANHLIQQYQILIKKLEEEKEVISRQTKKRIMIVTPLRQKAVKAGFCYFCDISIADDFAYRLKAGEQNTLGVEVREGATFCSQKCLWNYCKEYKNREKLRQEEKRKIKEKIEKDREDVTEIQSRIANLTDRINKLERKERELELLPESAQIEEPKKPGFWKKLGQKIGMAKKDKPLSKLERARKVKEELNIQLEKEQEELQKSLIVLSLDEQRERERKRLEEKFLLEKRRNISNEEEGDDY